MNKYPLDSVGILEITNTLLRHNESQRELINKLGTYLREAIASVDVEYDEEEWYKEAEQLIKDLYKRKMDFENFRFNQQNGHNVGELTPYDNANNLLEEEVTITPAGETLLNSMEEGFGDVMTEEELAAHFGEPLPKKPKKGKPINKMTLEEIKSWEASQDNSNDIYKIAARVKNLARADGAASLTPVGESLCNVFVHVLKSLYTFADSIQDAETKIKLTDLIRKQEEMPANFIMSVHNQVRDKKTEKEQ